MKIFFLFSFGFLALPLLVSSQTQSLSNRRVALTVAPNVAFVTTKQFIGEQIPQLGFHTRLDGEFRLKNRLWLRAGAGWSLLRFKMDIGKTLQWPSQVNANGQYDPSLPGEKLIVQHEEKMLTIPVALRYYFGKKQRVYADLEAGASLIFASSGDDFMRPSVGLAAGAQFGLGHQTWLFVQPDFRLMFNTGRPAILKSEIQHPYSLGLEMGVRRGL